MTHAHDEEENEMLWSSASHRTAYDTIGRRHVDLPAGYEFLAVPPAGKVQIVCANFPECMCGDDCIDRIFEESPLARLVTNCLMAATAAIGIAMMIFSGMQR